MPAAAPDERSPDADVNPAYLARLYETEGLSTYQIAQLLGIDRQRVTRALHRLGISLRPRGAGRRRPTRRPDDPPDAEQLMIKLYEQTRLSSREISVLLDIPERTVRDRLHRYGVQVRTRGAWNREERQTIPAEMLLELYVQLGMSAEAVGRRLGTSGKVVLRSAHAHGLPVRTRGNIDERKNEEIELIEALYTDDMVASVLRAAEIPRVRVTGPIHQRFPVPVPLSVALVKELYCSCGLALNHIELLTGQPAATVHRFMRRSGIQLRHPGGRTPFMRRWRAARQPSALLPKGDFRA